ncbi:MAG: Sua5/YciO/YrdC/YwlC family protein [Solirubrobacteraceae bacterium]
MTEPAAKHAHHDRRARSTPGGAFGAFTSEFERVIGAGGIALFPSDTVYGLACDPANQAAVDRLYTLKGRPPDKAAAVMFFDLQAGLGSFPELGRKTHGALHNLMPGKVTALLPNPHHRFPLACKGDPQTLGLRIVSVPQLEGLEVAVLQSSANRSGGPDAPSLKDVDPPIRNGVDLVIDGGELPGTASTVVDLRNYEQRGVWSVVRLGAVDGDALAAALAGRFHFDPSTYLEMVRGDLPEYDELQRQLVAASGEQVHTILDLGTGTGETAAQLLGRHPGATVTAVDENAKMLDVARERLGDRLVATHVGMLQDPLPSGSFELVSSALAIHHLDSDEKADLFRRIGDVLAPGGRFVLADLVLPDSGSEGPRGVTDGYDKPDVLADQLRWLQAAGFARVRVTWSERDLVVVVAGTAG